MKILPIILIIIAFTACNGISSTKECREENYFAVAKYHKLNIHDSNIFDTINIFKKKCIEKSSYLYNKKDSLIIYKDSVLFNNIKLFYKDSRTIKFKKLQYTIKKFLYIKDYEYSTLFINDSIGLILQIIPATYTTSVAEYDINELENLQTNIINDSLFFKPIYN